MISRGACAALEHMAKQAMFSCDTELDRWSVLGFFCAKLLSFSELPFGLGSLAFNVSAEIDCMGFCRSPDFHRLQQIRARRSSGRIPLRRRGVYAGR